MAPRKSLTRPTVRLVLAVLVLAAAVWVGHRQWRQRQLILDENCAVELQNQAQYAQAVGAYGALLPKLQGEAAQRVKSNLAACYVGMSEDPSLTGTEVLELQRQAYELDPRAVTNPAILKRFEAGP